MLLSLLHPAKKSDTEPSPAVLAREIDFKSIDFRTHVLHAWSDDNKEGFVLHNATGSLGDSPKGPDRLGRQPLARTVALVLKTIEQPGTSIACSFFWRMGLWQNIIHVDEIMQNDHEFTKEKFTPSLSFIICCDLVSKYVYDMCCSCRRRSSELVISNDVPHDEENQTSPLLHIEEERIESSSIEVGEVIINGKILIKRKN